MPRRSCLLLLTMAVSASAASSVQAGPLASRLGLGGPKTVVADPYGSACVGDGCVTQPVMQPPVAQPVMQQPVMQQPVEGCLAAPAADGCLGDGCTNGGVAGGGYGPGGVGPGGVGPGGCGPAGCGPDGPKRYSDEWWAMRAMDPPGARQRCKYGKKWPVYPRPTGPRQTLVHRYHTAHFWPHPYVCYDRTAVNVTVEMTARSGYEDLATLYGYHFDPTTNDLNTAGRQHLLYILGHADEVGRRVYVARGEGVESRLAVVEQAVIEIAGSDSQLAVLPRTATPQVQPSDMTERIYRTRLQTAPAPQLSSGGAGGGAAGGAISNTPQ